jgi:hypothetical protein
MKCTENKGMQKKKKRSQWGGGGGGLTPPCQTRPGTPTPNPPPGGGGGGPAPRVSAPVQTGPGTHSASYTMGTGSLSLGVKRPRRGVNHPLPSSAEVKERVELYLYFPSRLSWSVPGLPLPSPFAILLL